MRRRGRAGSSCDSGTVGVTPWAARAWWEREHTVSRMADDYQRLAARAAALPAAAWTGPADARPDPLAHAHDLVRPFGDLTCALF